MKTIVFSNLVCGLLLAGLLASCRFASSITVPVASPETVIGEFRRCVLAGEAKGLWKLYSTEHKSESPAGWVGVRDWLSDSIITEVRIRHRDDRRLADGHVTYHVAIVYGADDPAQRGNTLRSRVILFKQKERWLIQRIDPDYE